MKMNFGSQIDKFFRAYMGYLLIAFSVVSLFFIALMVEKETEKRDLVEKEYLQRIESMERKIEEQKEEIEALEEACSMKEGEISHWGRMYEECRDSRIHKQ